MSRGIIEFLCVLYDKGNRSKAASDPGQDDSSKVARSLLVKYNFLPCVPLFVDKPEGLDTLESGHWAAILFLTEPSNAL